MANVWVVRAEFGKYTEHFINGGYIGVGWIPNQDLGQMESRDDLDRAYREAYPDDKNEYKIGTQVGQISRFLFDIKAGDYVITPPNNTAWLHFGKVESEPSYSYPGESDGCPYRHRRGVVWDKTRLNRTDFSVPFQHTIRSSLTIFRVSHREEFLTKIGVMAAIRPTLHDPYQVVLERILELDPSEFEILIGHLLTALGFEGTEVTGKPGDGGVDVIGELNLSNLATVSIYVQAKRHRVGSKVSRNDVMKLRQMIPFGGQGAVITTADYHHMAPEIALEPGFPRIGLINGQQLVDLLTEHWASIPLEFQERLGLKPGLVWLG